MEKAMVSLDLLVSILVLVIVGTAMASFGFVQAENSVANNLKFKAEAMAMTVGSSINNFAAINPAAGSTLTMDLADPEPIGNNTLAGGWPAVGRVDFKSCKISFSSNIANQPKHILVTLTFYKWDSDSDETVIGKYPVVSGVSVSGLSEIDCSGKIVVNNVLGVTMTNV